MSRILLNKAFNREKRSAIFLLTSQTLKGGLNRRLEKIENKQIVFAQQDVDALSDSLLNHIIYCKFQSKSKLMI